MKGITRLAAKVFAALIFIIGAAIPAQSIAEEGELLWATQAGGNGIDAAYGIALDPEGSHLITGNFCGVINCTATFGAGEPNETVLSADYREVFVAKYEPEGSLLWVKQIAGGEESYFNYGHGIAVDSAGNSMVTGTLAGTATFGPGEPNETVLTAGGQDDIFLAKYDPDGALLWATQEGATGNTPYAWYEGGLDIALDAAGNSLVTGIFYLNATFGAGEPNETVLTDGCIFVAKYSPDGELLWAKQALASTQGSRSYGVAVDAAGDILVTGRFLGTETFGAGEPNETVLTAAGYSDIFLGKYDANGTLLWATQAGSADQYDSGESITVDGDGNPLVTGYFGETATFGAGEPNETVLTAEGGQDIFVAKYDANGALLWAASAGGDGTVSESGRSIAVDGDGNPLVTGSFRETATFGAGEHNETVLTAAGTVDIFLAKYDPEGLLLWVTQAGSEIDQHMEVGRDIVVDATGDSVIVGQFNLTATFGAGEPNQTVLISEGDKDVFLAKYAGDGQVTEQPDLSVAMEADPSPARVGRPWIYRLSVWNQGPSDATEVLLTDNLPERIKLLSIPEPCELIEDQLVRCLLGTLSTGEGYQLEIEVRPKGPGVRFNAACVESAEPDLNEGNNCAELETLVELPLDILE